jgi:hypothetical protein
MCTESKGEKNIECIYFFVVLLFVKIVYKEVSNLKIFIIRFVLFVGFGSFVK